MASALPKRDESVKWPVHAACGTTHRGAVCPPAGWLVLTLCSSCNEKTGYYCSNHRGRA